MRAHIRIAAMLCLSSAVSTQASGAFSSVWAFGDGVCTTTDNVTPYGEAFYGNRYCNGRVWIEVLAEWQGLPYVPGRNVSYYGHDSAEMVVNVSSFAPPGDVSTALFIVWANNADLVEFMIADPPPYGAGDIPVWSNLVDQSLLNHETLVTNLYGKGVRTLVLPTAADLTLLPYFGMSQQDRNFVRARITEFNQQFLLLGSNLMATHPGLMLHHPDSFALIDDLVANPSNYGITETDVDAITDLGLDLELDGPGADYLFWDDTHPSAKVQMYLADLTQRLLSPVRVDSIQAGSDTNVLHAVNLPVGRGGRVECSTGFADWAVLQAFSSTNTTLAIPVPVSGPMQFYRLYFPFHWTWP